MKPRCAVLDDYQGVAMTATDWTPVSDAVEIEVFREHIADEDALVDALAEYQIVVAMRERTPFPRAVLERLPKLRLIVTTGGRNRSVDVGAAASMGVTVCGTGGLTTPTVELTWALILGLVRSVVPENAGLRAGEGPWQKTVGKDLAGATLGVLGLGRTGSRVAQIGLAFGMGVQAWSQNLTPEAAQAAGVELAPSKEHLLAASDIVSIHLVLSERTAGLIGAPELDRMGRDAYLVNTSRGPIVDEAALVDALVAGRIAGAGLDVFDEEPLPVDHPFRTLPNVLATPHLGYVTQGTYAVFYRDIVEDIAAYLAGSPVRIITA